MAGRTARWAFNKFGSGIAGTITDDGGKFTGIDRDVMDRILAAYETHNHKGGSRLADPTDRPGLALDTTAGTLPAARTLFYRVSFIDRFGLESKASPELSVTTPYPLQPPGQPSVTASAGGTVRPGITYYALSLIQNSTETDLGAAGLVTISTGITPPDTQARRTAVVTFPTIPAGAGMSVWRQGATEGGFTRVVTLPAGTTSWTDDGSTPPDDCPTDPTLRPSGVNLTSSTNSVVITTPHSAFVGADPSNVKRWRIYRSGQSGVYGSKSLLAEIATTANNDGSGGLVTTFTDTGSIPFTTGIPLDTSQTMTPSVAILVSALGSTTVAASDGSAWRLVTTTDGALATTPSTVSTTVGRLLLTDSAGVIWRVNVSMAGVLSTGVSAPTDTDTVYPYGGGPTLPSPDGTQSYQLAITTTGQLDTLALGEGLGGVSDGGGGAGARGPKGDKGDPGDPGVDGPTGAAGTNGADGVGVPTGGTAGQVLTKVDGTDYNTEWTTETGGGGGVPSGGTTDEILHKLSSADGDVDWFYPTWVDSGYFAGGSTGQVLTKASSGGFDFGWVDPASGAGVPAGGTTGQVLTKTDGTDFDIAWADPSGGGSGGSGLVPDYGYAFDYTDNTTHSGVDTTGLLANFQIDTSGKGGYTLDAYCYTLENSYLVLNTAGMWLFMASITVTGLVPGDVVLISGCQDVPTWQFVCPPGQTSVTARVTQHVMLTPDMITSWSLFRYAFNFSIYSAQTGVEVTQELLRAILIATIGAAVTATDTRPAAPTGATAVAGGSTGEIDFAWAGGASNTFVAYVYRADQIPTAHVYDDWQYYGSGAPGATTLTLTGRTSGEVYTCWIFSVDSTSNVWSTPVLLGTVTVP